MVGWLLTLITSVVGGAGCVAVVVGITAFSVVVKENQYLPFIMVYRVMTALYNHSTHSTLYKNIPSMSCCA